MENLENSLIEKLTFSNMETYSGRFYNKKKAKYHHIVKLVEEKHNILLQNSINAVNSSLNMNIHIFDYEKYKEKEDKYIIEKITEGKKNRKDIFIVYKVEIKSIYIGDYILVITSNTEYDKINNVCLDKILKSIIAECESYIKIDKIGFSKYMGEKQDIDIENILNTYIDDYIKYCDDGFNEMKYYTKINQYYIEYFEKILSEGRGDIITHLNEISHTPYESKFSKGSILIIDSEKFDIENLKKYKNTLIFGNMIKLTEYKSVRKALAMTEDGFGIVSDGRYIYGISDMSNDLVGIKSKIKFNGNHSFSILDSSDKCIAKFKNGTPVIEEEINLEDVRDRIKKLFKDELDKEKINLNIESIMNIIKSIIKQSKGSMLVISNKAKEEAERLKYQSITIVKLALESEEIIKSISSIDGSILIDTSGECHSIGVILDGIACKIGDNGRGARYNSAIKYIYEQSNMNLNTLKEHKCMAVVISEDGMIDIIDKYEIDKLENEFKLDNFEYKLDDLNKKIEKNKYNRSLILERANIYLNIGEKKKALNDYNKALELNPKDACTYYDRGNLYMSEGEYTEALADYDKALENIDYIPLEYQLSKHIAKSMIYNNRGIIYSKIGKLQKAIEDYDKVIKLNPENSFAYNNRGGIYLRLREHKKSINDFSKAIELDTNFIDAYENRARTYIILGDYKSAKEDYTKLIEIDKSLMSVHFMRGYINYLLSLYKEGIEDYTKAIDLNSKNEDNYYHRAHCYICNDEYDKAINDFNKCIKINEKNAKAYFNRGYCYEKKEERDKVINDYNKAIALDPNYIHAYYGRAQNFWHKKNYKEALKDYSKVIELNPDFDSEIFFKRGNTYMALNKFKEASLDYTEEIYRNPTNSKAYANRASAFLEMREYKKAKKDAGIAILSNPCDEVAINILLYLKNIKS